VKLADVRSIGHNIADSLACGNGFLVGLNGTDIFGEACRSPERCIIVDFVSGKVVSGRASRSLAGAIALYGDALADLCKKHGTSPTVFRELTVRYSVDAHGRRFVVTVEDHQGRPVAESMWGSHQGASEYSIAWDAFAANEVAFWYVDGPPPCRDYWRPIASSTSSKRNPD